MSRRIAVWLVVSGLLGVPVSAESAVTAPGARNAASYVEANRLIDEAARAYRLRDFATTIDRLSRAYELSGALSLLYDLGDAHSRYYELDHRADHLRQARAFFRAFARRSQAAGESPRDAEARVKALSRRIAILEAGEARAAATPPCPEEAPSGPEVAALAGAGPRPERSPAQEQERAPRAAEVGLGLVTGGGVLLVSGGLFGALYLVEARTLTREADGLQELAGRDDCGIGCDELASTLGRLRRRGLVANQAAAAGISLGVLGGAMTAFGAVLLGRARRGPTRATVHLVPEPGGLQLLGRF